MNIICPRYRADSVKSESKSNRSAQEINHHTIPHRGSVLSAMGEYRNSAGEAYVIFGKFYFDSIYTPTPIDIFLAFMVFCAFGIVSRLSGIRASKLRRSKP